MLPLDKLSQEELPPGLPVLSTRCVQRPSMCDEPREVGMGKGGQGPALQTLQLPWTSANGSQSIYFLFMLV